MAQLDQVKQSARRIAKRTLWIAFFGFLIFAAGYYFYRTWEYSSGSRAGILFKISEKGYFFKTFEGQLHQGGSVMITEQGIFNFSVKDATTYKQLQQYEGKNVRLYYKEIIDAFPWQGDTNYLVYKVDLVQ